MCNESIFKQVRESVEPAVYFRDRLPRMPEKRRRADGWMEGGLCPFHGDKSPGSFHVNMLTGAANCFSCGAKVGDVVGFEALLVGSSQIDAARALASEWGVEV